MIEKPWCPAFVTIFVPAWIFPTPTGRKRSIPAARELSLGSFDVLHLFPQLLDFRFDLETDAGDLQRFALDAGRLGEHGVGFAVHLLQKKIEFFAEFAGAVEQSAELLQVTP